MQAWGTFSDDGSWSLLSTKLKQKWYTYTTFALEQKQYRLGLSKKKGSSYTFYVFLADYSWAPALCQLSSVVSFEVINIRTHPRGFFLTYYYSTVIVFQISIPFCKFSFLLKKKEKLSQIYARINELNPTKW